jgi:aspartyl protease family protein
MQELPRTLKILTVYGLIFVVLFLGFQWWEADQRKVKVSVVGSSTQVSLPRDRSGHYFWQGRVDGQEVEFLVDTGATSSAISLGLAQKLGLREEGSAIFNTANGVVRGGFARVTLELEGGLRFENKRISIMPEMNAALLGMDVLGKLQLQQSGKELLVRLPNSTQP